MKDKKIFLRERDLELLLFLAENGVVLKEKVYSTYGNERYSRRRVRLLIEAGILARKNRLYFLGPEGKRVLRSQGITIRNLPTTVELRKRMAEINQFAMDMQDSKWKFLPAFEAKAMYGMDRGSRLYGVLTREEEKYAIYKVPKRADKRLINRYIAEIGRLITADIERAVIFVESPAAAEIFDINAHLLRLREAVLLEYTPWNLDLLKKYGEPDFFDRVVKSLFTNVRGPKWMGADYTVEDDVQLVVLVVNDLARMRRVKLELDANEVRGLKPFEIGILCLREKEGQFRQRFSECRIYPVDLEFLLSPESEEKNNAFC